MNIEKDRSFRLARLGERPSTRVDYEMKDIPQCVYDELENELTDVLEFADVDNEWWYTGSLDTPTRWLTALHGHYYGNTAEDDAISYSNFDSLNYRLEAMRQIMINESDAPAHTTSEDVGYVLAPNELAVEPGSPAWLIVADTLLTISDHMYYDEQLLLEWQDKIITEAAEADIKYGAFADVDLPEFQALSKDEQVHVIIRAYYNSGEIGYATLEDLKEALNEM